MNEEPNPRYAYPISCSEGRVEFAKIRQPVSRLGQEASRRAIDGQVSIAFDRVVVFQPRNDGSQELNLSLAITIRSEVVDPNWLAVGYAGCIVDGVFEILLTTRTWSPEPMNGHKANVAAGRLAQFEESLEPRHVLWILEIGRSAALDTLRGIRLHGLHPVWDSFIRGDASTQRLSEAHEVLVTCSYTLLGVAGP